MSLNRYIFLILIFFSRIISADNCKYFEEKFNKKILKLNDFEYLEKDAMKNSLCSKNLIGKILYTNYPTFNPNESEFEKLKKAKKIFYELSQIGYPPAQYNLALISANESIQDKKIYINFLLGLHVKYAGDSNYDKISTKARSLLVSYINLNENINDPQLVNFAKTGIAANDEFIASKAYESTKNMLKTVDNIYVILSLGAIASTAASALTADSIRTIESTSLPTTNPWFDKELYGNPLNLNLYQWAKP